MNSCTFIGHRKFQFDRDFKEKLYITLEKLIQEKSVTVFYVGTQGGFDRLVYETLVEI